MSFRRYAAERAGITVLVLFLCACFCYVCFHVIGIDTSGSRLDPDVLARLHQFENQSFGSFLWQLVGHGSLGRGVVYGESLSGLVTDAAKVSISLASVALVTALLVGVPLGYAWGRGVRGVRFVASPLVYLGLCLIPIWVGILLQYWIGYRADELLPTSGYCEFLSSSGPCNGPASWLEYLILPGITLGLVFAAIYAGVTRRLTAGVVRARNEPVGARADAVAAARRHARVAFAKLVARNWFWLIGATVFVEAVFGLPGLGSRMFQFANASDLAGVQAVLLFASLLAFGGWLAIDLICAAISPHWREL